jgi:hypothetical protein
MASSINGSVDFKFFRYGPSLAAAIIMLVAVMVRSTFHLYQMISTWTWYQVLLVLGGFCQYRRQYTATALLAKALPSRSCRICRASSLRRIDTKLDPEALHHQNIVPSRGTSPASRQHI